MRSPENLALILIRGTLPPGLGLLREEARAEGFRHLDRLAQEWSAGVVRFDHPGESLLAAHHAGELVGVGGVTAEPLAGRYRMRRFYVRPAFRHRGIGGQQGLQSFTYTATDSQGASSAPTAVNVTVNGAWEAPTFVVNGEVDEKGQKAGTEDVINGSGIPATDYQIVRADDAGIELGLQIHYRNGPVVPTTDANGYADGVIEFQVASGPQTPATSPGFPAALDRAAWSFDYSVITGLNGKTTDLEDFTFVFKVDVDPTSGTDFQVFTMAPGGTQSAAVHWTNQFGDVVVDDRGIAGVVAQNSRNLAFYDVDHVTPGTQVYDPAFGPGEFDIVLQAFDPLNNLIAENHIRVDVI